MPESNSVGLPAAHSFMSADGNGHFCLVGKRCADCGYKTFPGFEVCPICQGERMEPLALSSSGTLYSWSVVHVAPKPWETPLIVGYVDLPENVRVFAHLGGDPSALRIDMPVRVEPAIVGVDPVGQPRPFFKFFPATGTPHA